MDERIASLSPRSRYLAGRIESRMHEIAGRKYGDWEIDDFRLNDFERYLTWIDRIGDDELEKPFAEAGDLWRNARTSAILKAIEPFGFVAVAAWRGQGGSGALLFAGRETDGSFITIADEAGKAASVTHVSKRTGSHSTVLAADLLPGLRLKLELDLRLAGERPSRWRFRNSREGDWDQDYQRSFLLTHSELQMGSLEIADQRVASLPPCWQEAFREDRF